MKQENKETLDFQANQFYKALEKAVKTKKPIDIYWCCQMSEAYETSLQQTIGYDIIDNKRSKTKDKYILTYAIAWPTTWTLWKPREEPEPKKNNQRPRRNNKKIKLLPNKKNNKQSSKTRKIQRNTKTTKKNN